MNVYWLEQTEKDLPAQNDWLSADEISRIEGMRFVKRRSDWTLGRWTAKRALASYCGMPPVSDALRTIEIRPEVSGAPVVFISGHKHPISISLSHRSGTALCAIAPSGVALGCDLELGEERHPAFITDYFTAGEQNYVMALPRKVRWPRLALLWSAKESALKALRTGLRVDTRSVAVQLPDDGFDPSSWGSLQVGCADGKVFCGWHSTANGLVRTIVADPPPEFPVALRASVFHALTADYTSSQALEIATPCDLYAIQRH